MMGLVLALLLALLPSWQDTNTDAEIRSFWAHRLNLTRSEAPHNTVVVEPLRLPVTRVAPATAEHTHPAPTCESYAGWHGRVEITAATTRWCDLITAHFPASKVRRALLIVECEANGDPNAVNPSSGTTGLFQHRPRYWANRSTKALGHIGSLPDPHDNIHVAAWLVAKDGWRHWDGCVPKLKAAGAW